MLYATYATQNFADISRAILRFMQREQRQLESLCAAGTARAAIAL